MRIQLHSSYEDKLKLLSESKKCSPTQYIKEVIDELHMKEFNKLDSTIYDAQGNTIGELKKDNR